MVFFIFIQISIALCRSKVLGEHSAILLQYFRPSLSYHLSLRSLFCLFLSGCFHTGFTVNGNEKGKGGIGGFLEKI